MHITEEQLRANRENSKRSTGPVTPEGRRKVAMNAIKHSFAGQTMLLQSHEVDAFNRHFESFRKEYRPGTATEQFLVQSLAEISWSTQQVRAALANAMTIAGNREWPDVHESHTPEIGTAIARSRAVEIAAKELNLFSIYESRNALLQHHPQGTHPGPSRTQSLRKIRNGRGRSLPQAVQAQPGPQPTRLAPLRIWL
jgi:hypothetical protein